MGKEVWGVEREPIAADRAASRLSRVICKDAETAVRDCPTGYFDCLIMADILEHLVDPWKALEEYRLTLRDGGCLIVSLPNIRFVGAVIPLVCAGQWEYREDGVLDRTHLRFFTKDSAIALVRGAGFTRIEIWPRVRQSQRLNLIVSSMQRAYYTLPVLQGFLAKQFIVRAKCGSAGLD